MAVVGFMMLPSPNQQSYNKGKGHNMILSQIISLLALHSSIIIARAFTTTTTTIGHPHHAIWYRRFLRDGGGCDHFVVRLQIHPSDISKNDDDAAAIIRQTIMVEGMALFFEDMIDEESGRFFARCLPPSGERIHQHNPIRDMAAAWDASKAILFLEKQGGSDDAVPREKLKKAIYRTIESYQADLVDEGVGAMTLDSKVLLEPSNIAHSALMLLASTGALKLNFFPESAAPAWIDVVTRGILSMQRQDGAFCIHFGKGEEDDNVYPGIEFFPGEAMVALMAVYELNFPLKNLLEDSTSTRENIVNAMERSFDFYSDYYHRGDVDTDTNFNIWQIQAFSGLFDVLHANGNREKAGLVANYVIILCQGVIDSKSWKYELARGRSFYPNLETVAIACGLDALVDGIRVAQKSYDPRLADFERHAKNAVYFLEWAQEQVPAEVSVGRGGLGYGGVLVLEQRLDITGHAISALTKLSSRSD